MKKYLTVIILLLCFTWLACEKEITVDLPDAEHKLVVEGRIELDGPPYLTLTRSVGYFEPADVATYENSFVHGAIVTVTVDDTDYNLEEVCLDELPPAVKPYFAASLGLEEEEIKSVNYCFYTLPLSQFILPDHLKGKAGKTYHLKIETEGKIYTSSTKVPYPVSLDSVWFKSEGIDTLGFAWAHLTDPDTMGNAYRWFAKRINLKADGKPKDHDFIAPFGSVFDDKFINAKSFDFAYDRGSLPNAEEDEGEEAHYFKLGDTIVVKFCSIDQKHFEFLRSYETEVFNNGNPFAAPSAVPTNIEGGALGVWGGYGVTYDTIFTSR